jgi:hypothetical protein
LLWQKTNFALGPCKFLGISVYSISVKETKKLFDKVFKQLMQTASKKAIIGLVNGLFGTHYSEKSSVSFPATVFVDSKLRELVTDMLIQINGSDILHIEAQIDDDLNMALRMYLYDFEVALRYAQRSPTGDIEMDLPKAIVLYWETTKKTPDEHKVTIKAPNGGRLDYTVPTYKVLNHDIDDLASNKMLLLLPFYMLKLRKQVNSALSRKTEAHEKLAEYAHEMKNTVIQIQKVLEKSVKNKLLTKNDEMAILDYVDVIFSYCYGKIKEFEEVTEMVEILTRHEKKMRDAARKLLDSGVNPDVIISSLGIKPEDVAKLSKASARAKSGTAQRATRSATTTSSVRG